MPKATPHETTTIRTLTSHLKNIQVKASMKMKVTLFYELLQIGIPVLADQQKFIYICPVRQ